MRVRISPPWRKSRHKEKQRVLRRLANIVCYSAMRMRRMTQYTASGMRLRKLLCPATFIFLGRVVVNSYQLFTTRLPATSTKKMLNLLILLGFGTFSFLFFAAESCKTHFDHIADHNSNWQININLIFYSIFLMIPVATPWMRSFALSSPRITIGCMVSFSGQRYIASSVCLYLLRLVCSLS